MIELPGTMVAMRPVYDPDKIGSLYIPDVAKSRADQGIVKYWGPKCKHFDFRRGDLVIFSGWTGTVIDLEDEGRFIIMPERYIQAIVHPAGTDINGLYFKDNDGHYFTATLEMAIEIMARSISDSDWFKNITNGKRAFDIRSKPEVTEYEEDE